jgi:hypothetical protein
MRYSRIGIIAVLCAAEVFIGGAILWAATGGHPGWPGGMSAVDVNSMSEQTRIDAGKAPHVLVSDGSDRVIVTASTDGLVHVTDHTHRIGWFWGSGAPLPLHVSRSSDGVSIVRGDGNTRGFEFFGIDFEQTEVAVPPQSRLEIAQCDGASITGVQAADVRIACDDGSLHLTDVETPQIDAVTNDGSIRASGLAVTGGRLQTGDGSIRVALATPNLTVQAQTADGSIRFNGRRLDKDSDSGSAQYQVGSGGGPLHVSTQDGSIHIDTNGAQ